MVLTVSFVLSPETGLCCLRRRRDAKHRHQLDTCLGVPGPHDFAVRSQRHSSDDVKRPSHPALNVRDDREAPPLSSAGRGELVEMICPTGIEEYFCEKDWTTQISLNPRAKFDFTRRRFWR
jgi:hypothetical protein